MAVNKNQHYVPEFYFKFFSADGLTICLLTKEDGRVVEGASIRDQCSKNYFYGPKEAEDLMTELDGEHSGYLRKCMDIDALSALSPDELMFIKRAAVFQRTRTLQERRLKQGAQDSFLQEDYRLWVKNNPGIEDKERALTAADCITANPKALHLSLIAASLTSAILTDDLGTYILQNDTDLPFIFGDAPVVFTNPYCQKVRLQGVLGLQSPGLLILYPLCRKRTLMFVDEEKYKVSGAEATGIVRIDEGDADKLNKLQFHNAGQVVYFETGATSSYLRNLWQTESPLQNDNSDSFSKVKIVTGSGEVIENAYYIYEPQLAFFPKLSFLDYEIVEERDYRFKRRDEELVEIHKQLVNLTRRLNPGVRRPRSW